MKKLLTILSISLCAMAAHAQTKPVAGKEYIKLTKQIATGSADKIEVVEFFFYGCHYCKAIDPVVEKWVATTGDKVRLKRQPLSSTARTDALQRMFFTLDAMGVESKFRTRMFSAVQDERRQLSTDNEIVAFSQTLGINRDTFAQYYNSFGVISKSMAGNKVAMEIGINSVPSFVINGKFLTSTAMTGSYERTIEVLDALTKQEASSASIPFNRVK